MKFTPTNKTSGADCNRHSLAAKQKIKTVANGTVAVNLQPIIYWIIKTGRVVLKLKSHAVRKRAKAKNKHSEKTQTHILYTL